MFSDGVSRSAIDYDARQTILWNANVNGMSFLITVLLVFTYLVCWTPYYVTLLIFMFLDPREQMSRDLQVATFFFGCSTAAINPLIYGAFHHHRHRHSRSGSRSSPNIRSSSSRTDTTFHHINLKKNQAKSSKVESLSMHVIKGKVPNDAANV